MLFVHAGLLTWSAWQHSPTLAEVQQLPAGLATLCFGRFDLAQVNPPLVRLLAAIPVAALSPKTDWQHYSTAHIDRAEYDVGIDFVHANGQRARVLFFVARCVCIPFSLLAAYICYRWASSLYGPIPGLIGAGLWCFSPSVLGHGQLISADIASASLGATFAYSAWRWLREPGWRKAMVAGALLGLAELTKFTCIVFLPLLVLWWLLVRPSVGNELGCSRWRWQSALQLALVFSLAIYIINWGYGFEGTPTRLREHALFSQALRGMGLSRSGVRSESNLARWAGAAPIPLPEDFIKGIDAQKVDFDSDSLCYLRGEWKKGGWWYYYLYALGIKTTTGALGMFLIAVVVSLTSVRFKADASVSWRDEMLLISTILTVLVLVSSQTSLDRHMRYLFPMLPFLFIWCSKGGLAFDLGYKRLSAVVLGLFVWSTGSSLWFYPHGLSYFNELVGGPRNGHYHLLFSNTDWGQDLFFLRHWLDQHPESKPLGLSSNTLYSPSYLGIDYVPLPKVINTNFEGLGKRDFAGPQPGWYALSVNNLHLPTKEYDYFLEFDPVDMAGYAIYIYHVGLADANRVRTKLSLPELPTDWEEKKKHNDQYKNGVIDSLANSVSATAKRFTPIRVAVLDMKYMDERNDDSEATLKRIIASGAPCVCESIWCEDIKNGGLSKCDVLLVSGGSGKLMAEALELDGRQAVREFVKGGGGYVGICAGAFLATDRHAYSLALVDAEPLADDREIPQLGSVSMAVRGEGIVTMELTDAGRRVLGDLRGLLGVRYAGGPVFSTDWTDNFPKYVALATYRTELVRREPQRGTMVQTPAVIAGSFGDGHIILFSPHPEMTQGLESLVRQAVLATARKPFGRGDP